MTTLVGIVEVLKERCEEILRIAQKHGVTRVRVFRSVARGDATAESEIDLLIDIGGPTTPRFPRGLFAELEQLPD